MSLISGQRLALAVRDGTKADIKYALDRIVDEMPHRPNTDLMAGAIMDGRDGAVSYAVVHRRARHEVVGRRAATTQQQEQT